MALLLHDTFLCNYSHMSINNNGSSFQKVTFYLNMKAYDHVACGKIVKFGGFAG